MIGQLGILLMSFREAFPRGATFNWFVVAVFGFIIRLDHHGVSSSIRWLRIRDDLYETFLAFFRSDGIRLGTILRHWQLLIAKRCALHTRGGASILLANGIKVAKEAVFMPGVKKLHQESENAGKAPWIFGHHFGIVGILAGGTGKNFCIPVAAELHEGAEALRSLQNKSAPEVNDIQKTTVVTLMGALLVSVARNLVEPCVAVLDAFFAAAPMFQIAKDLLGKNGQRRLHIITRAKNNAVAYELQPRTYCGRGRRPKYGRKIHLKQLFYSRADDFMTITVNVYGEAKTFLILCLDLFWKPLGDTLRFVLIKDGEQMFILMCSDLAMAPEEIVSLYASRFKIEVTFKMLKHIIGGFCYHFWTKAWQVPTGQSLDPSQLEKMSDRTKSLIADAMNAVETFVNLAMIATGLLQMLAIERAEAIWHSHQWWMRTHSSVTPSEEMVKTVIQHEFYHHFRKFKHTGIYRIIQAKRHPLPVGRFWNAT
jgi:hypothetical protein